MGFTGFKLSNEYHFFHDCDLDPLRRLIVYIGEPPDSFSACGSEKMNMVLQEC